LSHDVAELFLLREGGNMELKRRFGVIIVCGIPAIVGSGLLWELSEKWLVVYGYLFLLAATLLVFLFAPQRIAGLPKFGILFQLKSKD